MATDLEGNVVMCRSLQRVGQGKGRGTLHWCDLPAGHPGDHMDLGPRIPVVWARSESEKALLAVGVVPEVELLQFAETPWYRDVGLVLALALLLVIGLAGILL